MTMEEREVYGSVDWFYLKLSRLLDGGRAGAEAKSEGVSIGCFHFHSRVIAGSEKVCWVGDLFPGIYFTPGFLLSLDSYLRWMNAIQASLNDWLEGGRRRLVYSLWRSFYCIGGYRTGPPREEPSEASIPFYAVVVSAVVLLSLVYQYLTGNVDIGSSKAYSRSSLDFRDIYVAVVLFLGAYVWIKFREVAFKGVYARKIKDRLGRITKEVYEPRFKPPGENGQWIYLGQYATPEEAAILYQIAAFYYNKGQGGSLDLEDGRWFPIPPMSDGQRSLSGAEKRAWVKVQAMKVYAQFRKEKAEAALLLQELLQAWEDEATPSLGVDPSEASLLNLAEHQVPLFVSPAENPGMATAMPDDTGLECAPQSFGGLTEGFATSTGHSLGFEEESAIPIPQLPPDTHSGMGIDNSNQLNLLQIVHDQQQQLQELGSQILVLQNQQRIQQQQLEESRIRISQLEFQHVVQQQLQVIGEGVPSFDVEMEQSMPQQIHPCRPHGSVF